MTRGAMFSFWYGDQYVTPSDVLSLQARTPMLTVNTLTTSSIGLRTGQSTIALRAAVKADPTSGGWVRNGGRVGGANPVILARLSAVLPAFARRGADK